VWIFEESLPPCNQAVGSGRGGCIVYRFPDGKRIDIEGIEMKKLVFVLAMAFIGSVVFGQARTSDPSPSEFVLLVELTEATGWLKSEGEWYGNPNKIIVNEHDSLDQFNNFKAIRVYAPTYVGARYIVLELLYEGDKYPWTGSFADDVILDAFDGIYKDYYVFDPVKFIIQVDKTGQSVINNKIAYMQEIYRVREEESPKFSVWFANMKESSSNIFNFYTQYWKEDNVVRFYAGSSISTDSSLRRYDIMQEYYYECNADMFFDTFGKLIEKR
jgi:hypothetical protein